MWVSSTRKGRTWHSLGAGAEEHEKSTKPKVLEDRYLVLWYFGFTALIFSQVSLRCSRLFGIFGRNLAHLNRAIFLLISHIPFCAWCIPIVLKRYLKTLASPRQKEYAGVLNFLTVEGDEDDALCRSLWTGRVARFLGYLPGGSTFPDM